MSKRYIKTEQGITRPGYEASSAETAYTALGFNLIGTGGNCTAFHKPLADDRYILITVHDDAMAPVEAAEPVFVGLYGPDHSEPLDSFESPDSDAVAYQFATRYSHWLK